MKSLVTKGIQKGHMKMHLLNILNQFEANEQEKESAKAFFEDEKVTYNSVDTFLKNIREKVISDKAVLAAE